MATACPRRLTHVPAIARKATHTQAIATAAQVFVLDFATVSLRTVWLQTRSRVGLIVFGLYFCTPYVFVFLVGRIVA